MFLDNELILLLTLKGSINLQGVTKLPIFRALPDRKIILSI